MYSKQCSRDGEVAIRRGEPLSRNQSDSNRSENNGTIVDKCCLFMMLEVGLFCAGADENGFRRRRLKCLGLATIFSGKTTTAALAAHTINGYVSHWLHTRYACEYSSAQRCAYTFCVVTLLPFAHIRLRLQIE